jgi:phenylpyruvate tautomerase PptA (4-oxalocrotonate tautomerase family)
VPMIDVYASEATFPNPHEVARALPAAVMGWEQVPDIALFRRNTAAFVHPMAPVTTCNMDGESDYLRVEVLTPVGVLDRDKQLGVVKELTEIVAAVAGDPSVSQRTWVSITESHEGGWGIDGHAHTGADIADATRRELASP